jgi:FAD/FMN-containing dehydrogenase
MRGGGANFGIVTSFEFEADEVGMVGLAQFVLDAGDTARVLEDWGRIVESSPRDLTSFLTMGATQPGRPAIAQVTSVVDSDDPDTVVARLQPIADIAPLYRQQVNLAPYGSVLVDDGGAPHRGQGDPVTRSGLVHHITSGFAAAADRLLRSGAVYFFQLRSVGGAISDVDPDATAYAHRDANFHLVAFGADRELLDSFWDALLYPHLDGLYLSFETDTRPERIHDAFPPPTLARLRDLKARYDPDRVFRDNFPVTPVESAS